MFVRPIAIDGGVQVLAPAKLNLFLEVLGRRPDGFHGIESFMVMVDLFDNLTVHPAVSGELSLVVNAPGVPTGPENLVLKAAETLRQSTGCDAGARIHLEKAIPPQAGLGGGSSDAAATLIALNQLWGLGLPTSRLDPLAARLGSDVNFFLHGPTSVCRSRGEDVSPFLPTRTYHFVLVRPAVGVPTAKVFEALHLGENPSVRPIAPFLDAYSSGDPACLGRSLFNRLQVTAEAVEPALRPVHDALTALVASTQLEGAILSGSGSAYLGLARDRAAADHAARLLSSQELGWVRVVSTCGPQTL